MDDFLVVGTTKNNTQFYVSELSAQTLRDNGISSGSGLYLYEVSDDPGTFGIRVLASLPNEKSAYRMLDILGAKEPD